MVTWTLPDFWRYDGSEETRQAHLFEHPPHSLAELLTEVKVGVHPGDARVFQAAGL